MSRNLLAERALIRPRAPEHHVFLADVWGPSRCYSLENVRKCKMISPNKQLERAVPILFYPHCPHLPTVYILFLSRGLWRGFHKSQVRTSKNAVRAKKCTRRATSDTDERNTRGRLCNKSRFGRKMHSTSLPLQLDVSSECQPNCSSSACSL